MGRWAELEPPQPGLAESRLVLHYAVQLVAAVGQSLAPKAADDSQQSLSVTDGAPAWLGVTVAAGQLRAGLDPSRLELSLCDGAGAPLATLALAGRTMGDALRFLADELARRGQPATALALPTHPDFPRHPLADGARFPVETGATGLVDLFADTRGLLDTMREGQPLRLWPHHFDLGCSLQLGPVSLGLGVSPGDGVTGLPYWYATYSPPPAPERLPALAGGGTWHLEGWVGAELPLARLTRGADAQARQLDEFFRSALSAGRALA
jgi:hypothetical protein